MLWRIEWSRNEYKSKKFDGNTLWSTFYCLEDVIHGAHCNNISIDIIMPPLRCKFFSQAKREKQIFTFYIKTLSKYDSLSLSLFPLVFVLAEVSRRRRNLALPGLRGNQYCFIDHHFTQGSQWTLYFILCKILIVTCKWRERVRSGQEMVAIKSVNIENVIGSKMNTGYFTKYSPKMFTLWYPRPR